MPLEVKIYSGISLSSPSEFCKEIQMVVFAMLSVSTMESSAVRRSSIPPVVVLEIIIGDH